MSASIRRCPHSDVEHLRKFLDYAKRLVNDAWIYPPISAHRYLVALALYSKCLTVAEATLVLIEAGFGDEAFGMTRTLIDIYFTLRYIANKDTDHRARLYWDFVAKDRENWADIAKEYFPQVSISPNPATARIAMKYPNPHSWSGKTLKDMALEPDTFELDANGKPAVHSVPYTIMFRWTSHYVHPTIAALKNHIVTPGRDNFIVRSGRGRDMQNLAAFTTGAYVVQAMIAFHRCMGEPQPQRLANWANALLRHMVDQHR
ncbi:MAG TPA: DUF5677 domain-containing protein [Terriglobales bacterium]|nr:DUF5677 domain-containing protein [Terriglobales bacterium]